MSGPPPKPTHLKLIGGNAGKRRLNLREPMPSGDLAEPPAWLSQAQKDCWAYALSHAPRGLLKLLDSGALVVWVVASDLHRQAVQKMAEVGELIVKAPSGAPFQNPYLPIANRQAQLMLKAASELGFTPASRPRINMGEPRAPGFDPASKYFE